jgi:hypothetical protein
MMHPFDITLQQFTQMWALTSNIFELKFQIVVKTVHNAKAVTGYFDKFNFKVCLLICFPTISGC